jgi:hypothetical protein
MNNTDQDQAYYVAYLVSDLCLCVYMCVCLCVGVCVSTHSASLPHPFIPLLWPATSLAVIAAHFTVD